MSRLRAMVDALVSTGVDGEGNDDGQLVLAGRDNEVIRTVIRLIELDGMDA